MRPRKERLKSKKFPFSLKGTTWKMGIFDAKNPFLGWGGKRVFFYSGTLSRFWVYRADKFAILERQPPRQKEMFKNMVKVFCSLPSIFSAILAIFRQILLIFSLVCRGLRFLAHFWRKSSRKSHFRNKIRDVPTHITAYPGHCPRSQTQIQKRL